MLHVCFKELLPCYCSPRPVPCEGQSAAPPWSQCEDPPGAEGSKNIFLWRFYGRIFIASEQFLLLRSRFLDSVPPCGHSPPPPPRGRRALQLRQVEGSRPRHWGGAARTTSSPGSSTASERSKRDRWDEAGGLAFSTDACSLSKECFSAWTLFSMLLCLTN